ncbi:MAG: tetratricopeptide repeat protein [Fretibacterium sp.]|uniref:tetratricopeptide repeat protein n=1 Tax=Fretibacterium sp. OH1220_COT-178 TaxID=2491047 RepID=UPI00131519F8|nr:tetratricopeptide repeat protein [Fretibacterium sp. OH1220_COT-178]MDO4785358.1 tetratricopeptide repeat protein [Fretibacterium sp.]
MGSRKLRTKALHAFGTLLLLVLSSPLAVLASELQVMPKEDVYVGREIVLSLGGTAVSQKMLFEWAVSGDVKPIFLRKEGAECAFTPTNPLPIEVRVLARNQEGQVVASSDIALQPQYFEVGIVKLDSAPLLLWDVLTKEERPTEDLPSGRPIRFRAELTPPYDGEIHFSWGADASTAILSNDGSPEVAIARSEVGDAEVTVRVSNAAGITLGTSSKTVPITLPASRLEDSARQKKAWEAWLEAESLWEQRDYAKAMDTAKRAAAAVPEDPDISGGIKAMSVNYGRVLRSLELQERGSGEKNRNALAEALKTYRRAKIAWPMPDIDTEIEALEKAVNAIRLQRQEAEWLRDTASAYDQEGQFQEALEYYNRAMKLVPSEAVEERVARITQRLALVAEADKLVIQGDKQEKSGRIVEAIASYRSSLELNPDEALGQHVKRLEDILNQRKRQAALLFREGVEQYRKKNEAEALLRFRESMLMWPSPDAEKRIAYIEKTVALPQNSVVRTPEDFGIGTKADAARLLRAGDTLYGEKRYREALAQYRKSFAISQDQALGGWIRKIERSLKEHEAVQASNKLIKEANSLYKQGHVPQAWAKYKESLTVHPNAEVEKFIKQIEKSLPAASRDLSSADQGK